MTEPIPGQLVDYKVDEVSLVDSPANGIKFLLRKSLTESQKQELKAAGVELPEEESFFQSFRKALASDVLTIIKQFLAPAANQKGEDMSETNVAAEVAKEILPEDMQLLSDMVDIKIADALAPILERLALLEAEEMEPEMPEEMPAEMPEPTPEEDMYCKPKKSEEVEEIKSLMLQIGKAQAEQAKMLEKMLNTRPAGHAERGSAPAPQSQRKSVWAGSVFEQIAKSAY